jgi:hypothetical protein
MKQRWDKTLQKRTDEQVPSGGSSGQILKKSSDLDYDYTWQAESGSAGTFEIDTFGGLMPSETVNSDAYFEADGNNDLMPKSA